MPEDDESPSEQNRPHGSGAQEIDEDDVAGWVDRIRSGNDPAAGALWQTYFVRLVGFARKQLSTLPRREMDEEDVALSALQSFHQGVLANRFPVLNDRHDLWKILLTIAVRKVMVQRRRHMAQKRGGGKVRGESVFQHQGNEQDQGGIDQVMGAQPTQELAAIFAEQCDLLFGQLDDMQKPIALLKVEGYTNLEIADRLNLTLRTVERRLEKIRHVWLPEMDSLSGVGPASGDVKPD